MSPALEAPLVAPSVPSTRAATAARMERVPVLIFDDPAQMSRQVARRVAQLIESKTLAGEKAVLGLPTGSTPIGVYQELIRMHKEEGFDFSNVITFNLDEYFPIDPGDLQSYHRFMRENFFDHVNIPEENIHIPRGDIDHAQVEAHCSEFERKIAKAGGIDLMLLGVGRSGHIGFNEPGSKPGDRTRMIVLDQITRKDAASDFFEEKYVPREAITMGVGTILEAREIILMATGEHKAPIIRRAVEEPPNIHVSATYLQQHQNTTFYVDRAAAGELTREKTPWLVRPVKWDLPMAKRAVIWLSKKVGKAILHLDVSDFHSNHLHDLVITYRNIDELCRSVFNDLRERVLYRRDLPRKQRVIVFSPHPDDDVISMGGMLGKLVENDNDVTVAYMTNGSVAVFDQDVERHLRFFTMMSEMLDPEDAHKGLRDQVTPMFTFLASKKPAQVDSEAVQKVKAYIRYTEAIAGIEVMGLQAKDARFLDLPFYKTGRVKKDPVGQADVDIIMALFNEVKPDHIFVAGDLSDPHGTHRMCYTAIKMALEQYNAQNGVAAPADGEGDGEVTTKRKRKARATTRPRVWLYRGAWQEWEIDRAEVFLPLSKADLDTKIEAIYKHESQKDRALFPGAYDDREFWERARDRNRATAEALDALGLPSFYAAEAFVTVYEMP